jgi:nucleoside-diphosphate-sugar epimerase
MNFAGRKVLITGATGFIGARLVEVLAQRHRCQVRALVHHFAHASRIARFPIEMIRADIADFDAVARAAAGCDLIIHAAHGSSGDAAAQQAGTVRGTEAVMQAALRNNAERVVHFSSISVYGLTGDGPLRESSRRRWLPDAYSRNKAAAEDVALSYHRRHGLPVAVIQPTVVYGPYGGTWTVMPLQTLHYHQLVIPDGGAGLCNAVYVDDVVQAALLAAVRPEAVGETHLVSADEPVSWRAFYRAYERMLGTARLIEMTYRDFRRAYRWRPWKRVVRDVARLVQHPGFVARVEGRWLLRTACSVGRAVVPAATRRWVLSHYVPGRDGKAAPERELALPDPWRYLWQQSRTHVQIDKARACLGYAPAFSLEHGMALTHAWASWANLPGVKPPRQIGTPGEPPAQTVITTNEPCLHLS